jgi:hypothetical protein
MQLLCPLIDTWSIFHLFLYISMILDLEQSSYTHYIDRFIVARRISSNAMLCIASCLSCNLSETHILNIDCTMITLNRKWWIWRLGTFNLLKIFANLLSFRIYDTLFMRYEKKIYTFCHSWTIVKYDDEKINLTHATWLRHS